jgi:hypothetical protein
MNTILTLPNNISILLNSIVSIHRDCKVIILTTSDKDKYYELFKYDEIRTDVAEKFYKDIKEIWIKTLNSLEDALEYELIYTYGSCQSNNIYSSQSAEIIDIKFIKKVTCGL